MIHPDTRLITIDGVVGSGVIATRRIPRGTLTWVLDDLDRAFTGSQLNTLPPCYDDLIDRWTFHDGRGRRVLCWDLGRYLNHSCEPNCGGSEFWFEVALRDIEPGEQLTNDYATLYMRPSEGFACRCGALSCRGRASHEEVPLVVSSIHDQVLTALGELDRVAQPLSALLRPEWLAYARDVLSPSVPITAIAAIAGE
jgi:hypothetical protein